MAVKYQCPKCEKRYVEWGAKKLDFNCPDCENEKLVLFGQGDGKGTSKPSLKRKKRTKKKAGATKVSSPKAVAKKPKEIPAESDAGNDDDAHPGVKGENVGTTGDYDNDDLTGANIKANVSKNKKKV